MNLLALDLATHTGWALCEGGRTESGVEIFDVKRGESPGMRFVKFNRWLDVVAARAAFVVYEQPFVMRSGAAAEISMGLATRVQEYCARRGIDHAAVNGATLKKWTTGRGNAKKPEMVGAVRLRWAPSVIDDNQADAIALLHYALAELVGTAFTPIPGGVTG